MTRSGSSRDDNELPSIRALAWYGLAVILVAGYVNTSDIWRWLIASVGKSTASVTPFLITATALAIAFAIASRRRDWPSPAFVLGAVIALGALFLTDPDFPAKRIHVPQYMLLSLVLRRALFHGARYRNRHLPACRWQWRRCWASMMSSCRDSTPTVILACTISA